jgi:tetratricopeptide (TPR) repeat protein
MRRRSPLRLSRTSACRPILRIAAALASFSAPVWAGEWEDCQSATEAKMVAACTAVIEKRDRNPRDLATAHVRRGVNEQRRGLLDQAWADFDAATTLDPDSSLAFVSRGALLRQKGQIDSAASDFERAIALDPKNAGAYVGRGNVRVIRRDVSGALADFDQAIELRPDFAFAYLRSPWTAPESSIAHWPITTGPLLSIRTRRTLMPIAASPTASEGTSIRRSRV